MEYCSVLVQEISRISKDFKCHNQHVVLSISDEPDMHIRN